MGIFSRTKRAVRSKANAAIDKRVDPAKQIDRVILDLETQRKTAMSELISYKATAKQMEQELAAHADKAQKWERRAMLAIKNGEDETARKCLKEKRQAEVEAERIRRDRDEAAGYAAELNKSRKLVETKLRILKLKKGTLASQLAMARSGGGGAFANADELFERFESAEDAIDAEAIAAEVSAELGEEASGAELEAEIAALDDGAGGDALAALKAKMQDKKRLGD